MKGVIDYDLIRRHKWRQFLGTLDIGTYTIQFPDIKSMKSLIVSAYIFNSDGHDPVYNFSVDKAHATLTIKVIPRDPEHIRVMRATGYGKKGEVL